MQQRSEAYDLSLFVPKPRESQLPQKDNVIRLPQKKLEENRRRRLCPARAFSTFCIMAVMMAIVGAMVYSQVELTELNDAVNAASRQLEESESVYTQLKMRSDSMLSLQTVEDRARNELGMKKISQSQVEYINLSEGDKGQVLQEYGTGGWFSDLWNAIQNLLS